MPATPLMHRREEKMKTAPLLEVAVSGEVNDPCDDRRYGGVDEVKVVSGGRGWWLFLNGVACI